MSLWKLAARVFFYVYFAFLLYSIMWDMARHSDQLPGDFLWLSGALVVLWWLNRARFRRLTGWLLQEAGIGAKDRSHHRSAPSVVPVGTPRQPHELYVRYEDGYRVSGTAHWATNPDGTKEDLSHVHRKKNPFEGIPDPDKADRP
jgi:hypothetical protein